MLCNALRQFGTFITLSF